VFHRQLGEENVPEVRDVDHVAECSCRGWDLNRLPVRSFRADVFDLDMFYQ